MVGAGCGDGNPPLHLLALLDAGQQHLAARDNARRAAIDRRGTLSLHSASAVHLWRSVLCRGLSWGSHVVDALAAWHWVRGAALSYAEGRRESDCALWQSVSRIHEADWQVLASQTASTSRSIGWYFRFAILILIVSQICDIVSVHLNNLVEFVRNHSQKSFKQGANPMVVNSVKGCAV